MRRTVASSQIRVSIGVLHFVDYVFQSQQAVFDLNINKNA
jgi:hypothetical protein